MLFEPYVLGATTLANRVVMAPMTRNRAVANNTPNALMARYYQQRAAAGLIVTEGTSPSPNGVGYPRIPGLYNHAQVQGWRGVTDAVHQAGGKIFVQFMHTGRVAHQSNLPTGARVVGPSPSLPGPDLDRRRRHAGPQRSLAADRSRNRRRGAGICERRQACHRGRIRWH